MTSEEIPKFSELGLAAPVLRAVEAVGYEAPTSIQAAAIPPLLARRDLVGQAQTGTGKTAAFALPLLSQLDLGRREPQILVLTPTRELAIQVAEAMQTYARFLKGFHVVPIYGGQSIDTQLRQLRRGVHAVVGTPGRIQDHLRRRTLKLEGLSAVVLDEADEMLRMGFIDDVEEILEHTPAEKQVALFSATMPAPIRRVARKHLRDPVEIAIETRTATVATVSQRYWRVGGVNKLHALTRILEVEDFDAMLIFVRTRAATTELSEKLEARGFASSPLSGDMNQALRERTISRLKSGKVDIVVATDVAARGLDVDRISHVVNFDIPYDTEAYVHRIGRTARAGRKGVAILFVSPRERSMLHAIERATGQRIEPMQLPTREDVEGLRVAQFERTITEAIESQDLGFFEGVVENYRRDKGTDLAEIAAALAYLAQRERPLLQASPGGTRPTEEAAPERPAGLQPRRKREAREPKAEPRAEPRATRGTRPPESGKSPRGKDSLADVVIQRFRVEVGRDHGVAPGNIVGAISNEADLDGQYIGQVQIFDAFSLVDLPEGMPRDTFKHLKTVRVCGQELQIKPDGAAARADREPRKPPPRKPPKLAKKKLRHKKLRDKKRAKRREGK